MVDTAQSRVVGETKGYKTAYDPLSNELIIRPFHSKGGSYHPLGDNWHAPLPTEDEDGETCFRGEPREFFIEFMAFAETMTGERYTPSAGTDGVRFLVWARAMDFVLEQFPALLRVQGGEKKKVQGVTLGGVHEVFDKLEEKFAGVEFLRVEKGEGEGEEDELDEEVSALKGFVGECEWGMRCAAVAVRGKGKEGERKAEEAARMWGRIEEAIRGFEAVAKGEK
ncbi:MAG: hypothetical protein LQ338_008232 [Usnochroma carphineum]|nr:MAG: hypothetical protein LQ338_008232 [Usnochroma carphineum]